MALTPKLSPETIARLMASIPSTAKARVAQVPVTTNEQRHMLKELDAKSSQEAKKDEAEAKRHSESIALLRGKIALAGAPRRLEESGLTASGFHFDESQLAALKVLIHGKHVALIGAAGTGKTTMVKHALAQLIYGGEGIDPLGIRQLDGDQGPSIAICAFTGIATQVIRSTLPAWLHPCCKTIHSLLEYKPPLESGEDSKRMMFVPTRNRRNKLDHDVIVIDESSMLGLDLWHNLIDALRPNTRIILIGDINQLKPVADATMFAYALSAGLDGKHGWSIAELTTIHRQKEAAANKIVDAAHSILNGRKPSFDMPSTTVDWRFCGVELDSNTSKAQSQIIRIVEGLRQTPIPGETDVKFYDPYKDLLLTPGNGYDEQDSASFVQQAPLNAVLSRIIEPPSDAHPVYVIDAGRVSKRFAVGHRVMATKNEGYMTKDRVTNGLNGRITKIENNPDWSGNRNLYGTEKEVNENTLALLNRMKETQSNTPEQNFALSFASIDTSKFGAKTESEDRQASHMLTIVYANGAERKYKTAADIASIQLAYSMTTHKAQGSQADTVIVVVHHANKRQLSREWLYTAVTRARRRVLVLYTRMGLDTAIHRQQIYGANMREKVNRYRLAMESGNRIIRLEAYITLTEDDNAPFESQVEEEVFDEDAVD